MLSSKLQTGPDMYWLKQWDTSGTDLSPWWRSVLLMDEEEAHECSQCKGSGCAPCSLCHGSKFSMLANRFKESYRALRCPACDENGLQACQMCTDETEDFGRPSSPRS
ncbi:unnamed protein product [Ranitomeya imitator]|uniref:Uncharacterized protein n=1 Tax=Ranitomeya imitator TaxID=111125 RepID=A0ABN9LPT4_9NEOB|nr:unnamed protein product [Ranitomeya imitator]